MRKDYLFNYDWLYTPQQVDINTPDSDFEAVTIPHTNTILPHNNFYESEYEFISTYRKRFTLPEPANGRRVYLLFEGIMTAATVSINDHTFDEQQGGFVPFEYDITDYLVEGENLLTVSVDSHERDDIPPHGMRVDYLVFGGIYRDVHLRYVNPVHVQNVRVKTHDDLSDNPRVEVDVWVNNQTDSAVDVVAMVAINGGVDKPETLTKLETIITAEANSVTLQQFELTLDDAVRLWSVDDPYLHGCHVELYHAGETIDDYGAFPFGFRMAEFKDDGFYLNGEKLWLRGLNRHQMFPFIGAAAPQRLQERDAELIKEFGCNIVRTSHYPQSPYFLNKCDEIGLLVFEEIPGWQWIGDEDWKQLALRDVRAMIERDWNHPSIVIWGVRINESWDDDEFYTRTNKLARALDDTRPTTGVRFWRESSFLEDVFSFNDFSNGALEPVQSPWLITEYNGHMFPTKTWSEEERQMEHARRHAHVQSQAMTMGGISGAIGWCAYDYNTHEEFGSGDRVCYHGVFDMYRQPKWAAYVYRSQKPPTEDIVLQATTFWTMGDRAAGGNDPLYVLTNCDSVRVFVGDDDEGEYFPTDNEFPNLPHPPIRVDGLGLHWGDNFQNLRIEGYLDGEKVAEQLLLTDSIPQRLQFYAEDDTLHADGMDMTRLVFKLTDAEGNRCPFAFQIITLELLEGDAEIIGENPFIITGGQGALFLKAGRAAGQVRVRAATPRLDPVEIGITLASV